MKTDEYSRIESITINFKSKEAWEEFYKKYVKTDSPDYQYLTIAAGDVFEEFDNCKKMLIFSTTPEKGNTLPAMDIATMGETIERCMDADMYDSKNINLHMDYDYFNRLIEVL